MDNHQVPRGVKKRTPNACQRCRRHKIKCSGAAPCSNCSKRGKSCVFDTAESTVSVSKRYLSHLEKRLAALEESTGEPAHQSSSSTPAEARNSEDPSGFDDAVNVGGQQNLSISASLLSAADDGERNSSVAEQRQSLALGDEPWRQSFADGAGLTNPLSAGPSDTGFISDCSKGRSVYLGTSSNWAFSRRVLDGAHQKIYGVPLAPDTFALDGDIYSLGWDGSRVVKDGDRVALPSLNHAIYLVRSVQFHIGDVYHLLHEETFMLELSNFYENSADEIHKRKLWYVHYLLIMAFGKACSSRSVERGKPPGVELFVQAMKLIPDLSHIWNDPFTAAEIFCCAALYLQCSDYRFAAYLMIGHAIRTALFQGMHTDLPPGTFGDSQIERARHIWWTAYILDRELSSLMGLPVQLADENIHAKFPSMQSSEQAKGLRLHIKLCRIVAQVVSTVYGPDGSLDKRFLTSTKSALTSIANIAEELSNSFKLSLDDLGEGVSRLAATLHLQYHYCIVLTTRPLLFSLFKKRLEAQTTSPSIISSVERLRILLKMCTDSSEHSLDILSTLQRQDLIATFVPFDLESTYCSGIVTLLAAFVEPLLVENLPTDLQKTHRILDDMIVKGSLIACQRKAELEQLDNMLNTLKARYPGMLMQTKPLGDTSFVNKEMPVDCLQGPIGNAVVQLRGDGLGAVVQPFEEWTWEDALNSEQLMNVAGLLDGDQYTSSSEFFIF